MNEETIFAQAAAISPVERTAFLEEACQDNARLRARIDALLKAHDNPDAFLNAPAARVAATVGGRSFT